MIGDHSWVRRFDLLPGVPYVQIPTTVVGSG